MDHLPVPQDRCLVDLRIPFLSAEQAEYIPPFNDYPQRSGWTINFSGGDQFDVFVTNVDGSQDGRDLGSLAQNWLYFGLLSEFLGETVDQREFQARDLKSGAFFLTSKSLEILVCARTKDLLQQAQKDGSHIVQSFSDKFMEQTLVARHYIMRMVDATAKTQTAKTQEELPLVCLGVCLLEEYLVTATSHLCQRVELEMPIAQRWRLNSMDSDTRMPPLDCGGPIVQAMLRNGWCPHDVALLSGAQVKKVSTLWYIANLDAPRRNMGHESCSMTVCEPLQMSGKQYVQRHSKGHGCSCSLLGPDEAEVASIIWSERLPVVKLLGDHVHVEAHSSQNPFVAISHVWADGRGNEDANKLPLCTLHEIQRLVNTVLGENAAFWIDTICVPRKPRPLKLEALSRLREPYERASKVLVLDAYLESHMSRSASPFELLARIGISGWSRRLWTFQEGRLVSPDHVCFSFRDQIVNLATDLRGWFHSYSHFPTVAAHVIEWELLLAHQQTTLVHTLVTGSDDLNLIKHVAGLRSAFRTRTTSRAEDEALCLGSVLNLSTDTMHAILSLQSYEERMAKIWASLMQINIGIAFSKARRKLQVDGYRWAPATFMGDLDMSEQQWVSPNGAWDSDTPAKIVPGVGLEVQRPAWRLGNDGLVTRRLWDRRLGRQLCDAKIYKCGYLIDVCDAGGIWFSLEFLEAWHTQPSSMELDDEVVILVEGGPSLRTRPLRDYFSRVRDDVEIQETQKGVIGSSNCAPSIDAKGGTSRLAIHRHVVFNTQGRDKQEILRELKKVADRISLMHGEVVQQTREDCYNRVQDEEQDERWKVIVTKLVKQHMNLNTGVVQLTKSYNIRKAMGEEDEIAFEDCRSCISRLLWFGTNCVVQQERNDITWRIN